MQSAPQIHEPLPQIGRNAHATDFTSAGARSEDRNGSGRTTRKRAPTSPYSAKGWTIGTQARRCPRSAGDRVAELGATRPRRLRGHVVLVDVWTLTCINWLRQEPYVRAWSQAYRDDGLVVTGVHTPEFSFEHELHLVRQATRERGIDYPVALDNDCEIWSAFDNHYGPALYFVDADGIIRDHDFGEGRYEQSERVIQRLLGVERKSSPSKGEGFSTAKKHPSRNAALRLAPRLSVSVLRRRTNRRAPNLLDDPRSAQGPRRV
jgi:hypothetical protein